MDGLEDYGALLRSGQAAVPDYAADEARKQLLSLQRAQEQRLTAEARNELADQQGFQTDLTTVLAHPSAQGYSALIAKHPKFAQQVKASWDLLDQNRQNSDLQAMSEIYSAAANGKNDLAAGLMKRRVEADRAAGQDTTHDQAILDALSSGDPVQQKGALGMIGVTLSAVTGPEKFEQTLGQLTKGMTPDIRNVNAGDDVISIDPQTGQAKSIYKSPYVKTADGGILERDGTGGGDPASGAAGSAPSTGVSPAASSVASTLSAAGLPAPVVAGFMGNFHAEGGYNGAQGDGGSASGIGQWRDERAANFQKIVGKPVTDATPEEQAKFVAWEMQNPKAAGMTVKQRDAILAAKTPAQAAALIDQFYERSSGRDRNIRMSAANAFAGGSATGGVSSAAAPATDGAPPGYHWLTQPKPKDAPSGYRYAADGKTLEAIPGGPADQQQEGFDPQAVEFSAQQYLATGQMPTLGMGKAAAAARKQIIERAAKIAGADGLTGTDFAVQIGHYKAATQALKTLETQAGTVEQNEKTALMNGQQFLDRSKELPGQTGVPLLNSVVQAGQRNLPVAGHDTVAAMDAAWNTFTTEYAKVVAGSPSGAGTLSDSARHEAQATMKGNYSYSQKVSAFNQMRADMANRMAAIHQTIAGKYETLTKNPRKAADIAAQTDLSSIPASNAPSDGAVRIHSAQEWQALKPGTHYIDPTGVARVKK